MAILDRFSSKIEALRDFHEGSGERRPYNQHGFITAGNLHESEIQRIENKQQLVLPPEYRAFLQRFGDGIVGPGNRFIPLREAIKSRSHLPFPLSSPFFRLESPSVQHLPEQKQREEYHRMLIEWEAIPKDQGSIMICDYGCAMYGILILNGPFWGKVWMLSGDAAYYGPFGGAEGLHDESTPSEWQPTETPKDYSFFEWYESWLDGELKMAGKQIWEHGASRVDN